MLQNEKYMFCFLVQAFNSLIALEAGIDVLTLMHQALGRDGR